MSYINNINTINGFTSISGFGNTFLCTNAINEDKTVDFPDGYNQDLNISFKVIFQNGHQKTTSENMTLNGIAVVANKFGTLIPIPNHEITTGNFSTLQANTVLEMYYTNNYDGNNNPAFVIIGNPVVLSSVDYTIYADGKIGDDVVGTIKDVMKSLNSNTTPYGWLICNGTSRSESNYPDLYAILPSTFKNTTNHTFIIDLREVELIGYGTSSRTDIGPHDGISSVGSFREDQFQGHGHLIPMGSDSSGNTITIDWLYERSPRYISEIYAKDPITYNNGAVRYGNTTHGKQVSVTRIIKALP